MSPKEKSIDRIRMKTEEHCMFIKEKLLMLSELSLK